MSYFRWNYKKKRDKEQFIGYIYDVSEEFIIKHLSNDNAWKISEELLQMRLEHGKNLNRFVGKDLEMYIEENIIKDKFSGTPCIIGESKIGCCALL